MPQASALRAYALALALRPRRVLSLSSPTTHVCAPHMTAWANARACTCVRNSRIALRRSRTRPLAAHSGLHAHQTDCSGVSSFGASFGASEPAASPSFFLSFLLMPKALARRGLMYLPSNSALSWKQQTKTVVIVHEK